MVINQMTYFTAVNDFCLLIRYSEHHEVVKVFFKLYTVSILHGIITLRQISVHLSIAVRFNLK